MIGIYLHVPFCRTRCPYCDFVSEAIGGAVPEEYIGALCREINAFDGPEEAGSVFFGGGTPSLLSPKQLERILAALHKRFALSSPEITLEANPDDVTEALAKAWRAAGVNRISLGVQSFDDDVLRYLGRRHDAAGARRACDRVAARFGNWSMDLIFGAPPIARWGGTLAECAGWAPKHVSAYGLTYEQGTPFGGRAGEAVEPDVSLSLYQQAENALGAYIHYEISNFAQPGFEARHNLLYWHNGAYAGFGAGAYSFISGVRGRNAVKTAEYIAAPGRKSEALALTEEEIRVETLIQYFRLRAGLPKAEYHRRFGVEVQQDFGPKLAALVRRGLLQDEEETIRPTREGFYLNNEIGLVLVGE